MAEGKKIKYEDLFDPKLDDQVKQLEATFKSLKDSLKEFAAVAGKEIKMTGMKTPEDMQKLAKGINDVESAAKSLKIVEDEEIKAKLRWTEAERERTAALKAQVKEEKAAEGSINQLRARLSAVTLEWAKLSKEERENTKAGKDIVNSKKQLTEELKKLEAATGDHRRNVGNYTESLKGLPGPIGAATNSAIAMGESLWALVANPVGAVLAAIAAAGYLVYESFTFTDTGANKVKATLMGLKDAYDNIKFAIGEFLINNEGVKNALTGLLGVTNPLITAMNYIFKDPIANAEKYVEALDEVEDAETAYISKAAENRNKIARLEFTAADPSELKEKRIQALNDAIALQEEEAAKSVNFAQKKYDAEVNRIADSLKIKAEEVKRIVALDDVQQMSEAKKNKAIRDLMEFDGGERLKLLEEMNAAVLDADTKQYEETKANNKKKEKLLMDLEKAEEERRKKKAEADKKEAEAKKKAEEDEKKRQADLLAFYNKSIDEQIFALETERMDKKNKNELMYNDQIEFENKIYAWRIQKAGLSYDELERLRVEHEAKLKEITENGGDGGEAFQLLLKERQDYLDKQKEQLEQQREDIKKASEDILKAVEDGLKERAKLQQDADQKAIDNQKKQVERQAQLAAEGKENVLAAEEAALARAERKKLDDAKKAQKQQEALELAKVFLNLVSEYSKDNPNNATAKALAMTLIAKGISRSIAGAFATGVEGLDGEGTETSDSNLALLSKGESVITAKGTKSNPGLATAMNTGTVDEYFKDVYMPQFASSNRLDIPKAEQVNNALFKVLTSELSELKQAIREKPVSMTKLNGLGEWTEEVQSANMRIITHHRKGGNRF